MVLNDKLLKSFDDTYSFECQSGLQLKSLGTSYNPRVHERLIDHIQSHSELYRTLAATAAVVTLTGLLFYAVSRPIPDSLSPEDKIIMQEQLRLEKLYDSGVPVKHIRLDDGSFHTVPASEYNAK